MNEKLDEKPELTSKDLHAVLCICLRLLGPVGIPEKAIKQMPEGVKLKVTFDEVNRLWYFIVPVKRKRGIMKPKRKLILPGMN